MIRYTIILHDSLKIHNRCTKEYALKIQLGCAIRMAWYLSRGLSVGKNGHLNFKNVIDFPVFEEPKGNQSSDGFSDTDYGVVLAPCTVRKGYGVSTWEKSVMAHVTGFRRYDQFHTSISCYPVKISTGKDGIQEMLNDHFMEITV